MLRLLLLLAGLCAAAEDPLVRAVPGWGTWRKRAEPVLAGQYGIAGDPSVVRDGAVLRMAFSGFDPAKQGPMVCIASSADGLAWREDDTGDALVRGRLLRPGTGPWEDTHETPFLLRHDGRWLLWFLGYRERGGWLKSLPGGIGVAVAGPDRRFAAPQRQPVLAPVPGGFDGDTMTSPTVVRHQGRFWMVYAGHRWVSGDPATRGARLLLASSADGLRWERAARPLLEGTVLPAFCTRGFLAEPELVIGPDRRFWLFATATQGERGHCIALARAARLEGPWEFAPQPILVPGPGFDAREVVAPSVLIEDGRVRLWYAGFREDNKAIAIGYAEAAWPLR